MDKDDIVYFIGLLLLCILSWYCFSVNTKNTPTKNVGFIDESKDVEVSNQTEESDFNYIKKSKENISTKTSLATYNLEDIDKVSKFTLNEINKDKNVCYNIIEIHRVKKEIDSNDITSYSLDLYLYDHMKNFGSMIRTVTYEINGVFSMKDAYFITPIPMSDDTNDGFTFDRINNDQEGIESSESDPELNKNNLLAQFESLY